VIPIPGHTSGSTAFLWDTGQHRCLFSADTVYVRWTAGRGGPWHAMTDKADARRRIDAIIDRLRRGNH
jgi:glyoxylase-like metal-dependent hydrolase (beta-lactamase superfamily II)